MNIETKYHGEVTVESKDILSFPSGLPGFEEEKEFVLLSFPDNDVFYALQSTGTPELSFVVVNPFSFFVEYNVKIEDTVIDFLAVKSPEDVTLLTILTVQDPFENTTANLQAPLVINKKVNKGRQVILTGTPYETRHNLFQAKEA